MGNDCCTSSGANVEAERNMLGRDPPDVTVTEKKPNEIKGNESEPFLIRVDNDKFFSLTGMAKKKPGKQFYSSEKLKINILD